MKELDKISASIGFKALMIVVSIAAFISIFTIELQTFFVPIVIMIPALAIMQMEDYYLAGHFIKKRKERILHSDIKEVRKLLWWWIITDEYGDSMWINYSSLTKENKQKLSDWLRPRAQN